MSVPLCVCVARCACTLLLLDFSQTELLSLVTKTFFLLCLCLANSKSFSLRLHPMWHSFAFTVFQALCPCPKIMAGGVMFHLTQGSQWVWRGDAAYLAPELWPTLSQISVYSLMAAILKFHWA